ncbi:MAG: DUF58 domain-containing protein [Deltaproteobacteria bacterium]
MLTERAKITLFFLGVSLIIAFYTQVELIFFIMGILASILAVSYIIFRITQVIDMKCMRILPNAVYEEECLRVKLLVENRSRFNSYFIYLIDDFTAGPPRDRKKKLLFAYLSKRATIENTYDGYCPKRGIYWIGPLTVITSDPLGFFRKDKIVHVSSKLTVYPKVFNIRELGSFNKGVVPPRYGAHTTRKSGDYEEFFGIREYHQEDGLRKIHWPSSARHNQLMVRHFEQTGAYSATIILDLKYGNNLGAGKETTLEYSVKIAASLAKYFLDQGFLVQLLAYGEKPIMTDFGKDPSHFSHILELLAEVESNSPVSIAEAMSKLHYFIHPNSTLAVIRLDRDDEASRMIEQLIYTKNISVFDIQLVSATFGENVPEMPAAPLEVKGSEVITYYVSRGDNLEYKFIRR